MEFTLTGTPSDIQNKLLKMEIVIFAAKMIAQSDVKQAALYLKRRGFSLRGALFVLNNQV